jgi:hypothetical protein
MSMLITWHLRWILAGQSTAPLPSVQQAFGPIMDTEKLVVTAQKMADTLSDVALMIAFVLMVVGAIEGFLHGEQRKFFSTLVRLIIVTCLIFGAPFWRQWLHDAADGIANRTVSIQMQLGNPAQTFTFRSSARPDLDMIQNILKAKYPSPFQQNNQNSSTSGSKGGDSIAWFKKIVDEISRKLKYASVFEWANFVIREIVLWLLSLIFRFCIFVAELMTLLQQVIIIFLSIYLPIALAELSIHALRTQGIMYLKTFVGAYCWPVGWVFVNIITVAMLSGLPQADPDNLGSVLLCLLGVIPIFFWTSIGHLLAPFYAQKIVTQGGAALQGFTGAMLATAGPQTASAYSGIAKALGGGIRGISHGMGTGINAFGKRFSGSTQQSNYQNGPGADQAFSSQSGEACGPMGAAGNARQAFPSSGFSRRESSSSKAANLLGGTVNGAGDLLGAGLDGIGQVLSSAGNLSGTLGSLTAHAAGDSIGSARNLSPARPRYRRSARSGAWQNSSDRAQQYLWD